MSSWAFADDGGAPAAKRVRPDPAYSFYEEQSGTSYRGTGDRADSGAIMGTSRQAAPHAYGNDILAMAVAAATSRAAYPCSSLQACQLPSAEPQQWARHHQARTPPLPISQQHRAARVGVEGAGGSGCPTMLGTDNTDMGWGSEALPGGSRRYSASTLSAGRMTPSQEYQYTHGRDGTEATLNSLAPLSVHNRQETLQLIGRMLQQKQQPQSQAHGWGREGTPPLRSAAAQAQQHPMRHQAPLTMLEAWQQEQQARQQPYAEPRRSYAQPGQHTHQQVRNAPTQTTALLTSNQQYPQQLQQLIPLPLRLVPLEQPRRDSREDGRAPVLQPEAHSYGPGLARGSDAVTGQQASVLAAPSVPSPALQLLSFQRESAPESSDPLLLSGGVPWVGATEPWLDAAAPWEAAPAASGGGGGVSNSPWDDAMAALTRGSDDGEAVANTGRGGAAAAAAAAASGGSGGSSRVATAAAGASEVGQSSDPSRGARVEAGGRAAAVASSSPHERPGGKRRERYRSLNELARIMPTVTVEQAMAGEGLMPVTSAADAVDDADEAGVSAAAPWALPADGEDAAWPPI